MTFQPWFELTKRGITFAELKGGCRSGVEEKSQGDTEETHYVGGKTGEELNENQPGMEARLQRTKKIGFDWAFRILSLEGMCGISKTICHLLKVAFCIKEILLAAWMNNPRFRLTWIKILEPTARSLLASSLRSKPNARNPFNSLPAIYQSPA